MGLTGMNGIGDRIGRVAGAARESHDVDSIHGHDAPSPERLCPKDGLGNATPYTALASVLRRREIGNRIVVIGRGH